MSSIAAIMLAKDCIKLDYCPYETILTTLGLNSLVKFYINEGYSSDNTYEIISSIKDPRIEITRNNWHMDKSFWVVERNKLINEARKHAEYLLILDADEFLFEESIPIIDSFVNNPGEYKGMHFNYRHFYRISDGNSISNLMISKNRQWYQSHAKLIHFSLEPRLETVGYNADDVVGTLNGKRIFLHLYNGLARNKNLYIGHLGYARDAAAFGLKLKRNETIYQNSKEFIDGKIPPPQTFSYLDNTNTSYIAEQLSSDRNLEPIDFNIPKCILDWIEAKERRVSFNV